MLVVAASLAGCGTGAAAPPAPAGVMADSFDQDIFGPQQNGLHSPYLAGAQFSIYVTSPTLSDTTGWTLASSDPAVIRVVTPLSPYGGDATVIAGGDGQATLTVRDASGALVDSQVVTVALPDTVSLFAEGLLLTGAGDAASQVTEASIVTGGDATFLVRYWKQGTELAGSGALQATASSGMTATTSPGGGGIAPARDFLYVAPPAMGASGSVKLMLASVVVSTIPITTVDPATVTHVDMVAQSTESAKKGDMRVVYAHAVDANAANVYGASFDWSVNGLAAPIIYASSGPSDLFEYTYNPSASETVGAAFESFSPTTVVRGQGGIVDSTADQMACAVRRATGTGGTGGVAAVMVGIGLIAAGRRRRKASFSRCLPAQPSPLSRRDL